MPMLLHVLSLKPIQWGCSIMNPVYYSDRHWKKEWKCISLQCECAAGQWGPPSPVCCFGAKLRRVCFSNSQLHFPLYTRRPLPFDWPAKMAAGHLLCLILCLVFSWDFHSPGGSPHCLHLACSHWGIWQQQSQTVNCFQYFSMHQVFCLVKRNF